MSENMQNQTIELDLVGQYYAAIIDRNCSGVFAITVYLKETVNPKVLQQAFNDLMIRLPFLNGKLQKGFFHYKHKLLQELPKTQPISNQAWYDAYYNQGAGHMVSVIYCTNHFTVRTTHSICDGRGISRIARALTVRYFQLLGVKMELADIIDCDQDFNKEEMENAYVRYATKEKIKITQTQKKIKAYHSNITRSAKTYLETTIIDVNRLKIVAKKYNATITEYILAQIFLAIKQERDNQKDKRPITALIPIDCRTFFPSLTIRTFVMATTITMPETNDLKEMITQIKGQFENIQRSQLQAEINEFNCLYKLIKYIPRVIKRAIMRLFAKIEAQTITTGFSNLGLVTLPKELENRVTHLEFPISLENNTPYFFSCIALENNLAFSATFKEEGKELVKAVLENLSLD